LCAANYQALIRLASGRSINLSCIIAGSLARDCGDFPLFVDASRRKPGTRFSTARAVEKWIPAFAAKR
jgi:hypothetical protein